VRHQYNRQLLEGIFAGDILFFYMVRPGKQMNLFINIYRTLKNIKLLLFVCFVLFLGNITHLLIIPTLSPISIEARLGAFGWYLLNMNLSH